jgi:serine/threonine protein kinase
VIGDLGLAKELGGALKDGEQPTMMIGTPLHMAPEHWDDSEVEVGQPVDVYAYAVLLYSMFVADPMIMLNDKPGRVRSVENLMQRIGRGARFQRSPDINNSHWRLIESGWDKAPDRRPTFQAIVNVMTADVPKFLFPESNEAVVRQSIEAMVHYR